MDEETKEKLDKIDQEYSVVEFRKLLKLNILKKIRAGETDLMADLDRLEAMEKRAKPSVPLPEKGDESKEADGPEDPGIPEKLRIRRHYTLSPAALEQRRKAANSPALAEAMKGNKNPWKHGKFAQGYIESFIRPCKSTCPDYPCDIVDQKGTKPGDMCLDRAAVIQGYTAIVDAMKGGSKNTEDFNELAALTLSKTIQTIHMLMDDIMRDGTMAKKEKYDKNGTMCGYEIVPHPSLFALPKLLQGIGLTPAELMLTPQAIARHKVEKKAARTIADLMSGFGKKKEEDDT